MMADKNETNVNTEGDADIGGNASAGGDVVGRDKINIDLFDDNRTKQGQHE
jgi:hypothetical protein